MEKSLKDYIKQDVLVRDCLESDDSVTTMGVRGEDGEVIGGYFPGEAIYDVHLRRLQGAGL